MTILTILGYAFVAVGLSSLVLNEFSVQRRRDMWSWRRDEHDPERDQWLDEFYRLQVYVTSVAYIEIGHGLSGLEAIGLPFRVAIYLAFGLWLGWRRPALKHPKFWRNFGYHPWFN